MGHSKYKRIGYVVDAFLEDEYLGYLTGTAHIPIIPGEFTWTTKKAIEEALLPDPDTAQDLMLKVFISTTRPIQLYVYPVIEDVEVACGRVKQNYIATVYRKVEIK